MKKKILLAILGISTLFMSGCFYLLPSFNDEKLRRDAWGYYDLNNVWDDLYLKDRRNGSEQRLTFTPEENEYEAIFLSCKSKVMYSVLRPHHIFTPSKITQRYIVNLSDGKTEEITKEEFNDLFRREIEARYEGKCMNMYGD